MVVPESFYRITRRTRGQLKFRDFEEEVEEIVSDSCSEAGYKDVLLEVSVQPNYD